jgi:molybdenum cofactor cytidylyltransferase
MSVAAVVLAAGGAVRMGRPKQLVEWKQRPLLEHVIAMVAGWPVDLVAVVLGAYSDEILERVDFGDALAVVNPEWEEGLASSIRVGMDVLMRERELEQAFVALGDQPEIHADVPPRLLEMMESSGRLAAVPVYRYQRGNPVLIARPLWPQLAGLSGDQGAAGLLKAHPQWVQEVRFDYLPPTDVDVPDDLERRGG